MSTNCNTGTTSVHAKKPTFRQIPDAFLDELQHTPIDYVVYAWLLRHYNPRHGFTWVSQATLAKEIGKSLHTIQRSLYRMMGTGWIDIENTYNTYRGKIGNNEYTLPMQFPDAIPQRKTHYKICELNTPAKQKAAREKRNIDNPLSRNDDTANPHGSLSKQPSNVPQMEDSNVPPVEHQRYEFPNENNEPFPSPLSPSQSEGEEQTPKHEGDLQEHFLGGGNPAPMNELLETISVSGTATISDPEEGCLTHQYRYPDDDFSYTCPFCKEAASPSEPDEPRKPSYNFQQQAQSLLEKIIWFNGPGSSDTADWLGIITRCMRYGAGIDGCHLILRWVLARPDFPDKPYAKRAAVLVREGRIHVPLLFGKATYPEFLALAQQWDRENGQRVYYERTPTWRISELQRQLRGERVSDSEGQAFAQGVQAMLNRSDAIHAQARKERRYAIPYAAGEGDDIEDEAVA